MSEEFVVEFEEKKGKWYPVTGTYRTRERADERSKEVAEELGKRTRVVRRPPIWEDWNFRSLTTRLRGTDLALREVKKRGEAGAIAGWAIYKAHIRNLIGLACGEREPELAREPAYRSTMLRDMRAVGEDELVEQIEGLWRKYPKAIPLSEALDLKDDWDEEVERRVGRTIPKTPGELTTDETEESRRITRELYEVPRAPEEGEEEEIKRLEKMRAELEEKLKKLRRRAPH